MKNLLAEDVMNEFWIFETDQHAWNLLCFASCCAHRLWADVPFLRRSPLCEPKKQKQKQKIQRKKLTLKGHKSFGSDALENLSSCAASTSILWLLIFFGLVRQTSHQPFEKRSKKRTNFLHLRDYLAWITKTYEQKTAQLWVENY